MNNIYKSNWAETKERFSKWWNGENFDRPLMRIVAHRDKPLEGIEEVSGFDTLEEKYIGPVKKAAAYRNYCRTHISG